MQVMLMKSSYLIMAFAMAFYGIYSFAFQLYPKNTVKSFVAPAIILVWVILQLIFTPSWDLFSDNANRVGFLVILEVCASGYLIIFQLRRVAKWKRCEIELRVMTSECITVQEKRISGSGYCLVLSNGEETYDLPVSETIYNSYHSGDSYRHDADQKDYANLSD